MGMIATVEPVAQPAAVNSSSSVGTDAAAMGVDTSKKRASAAPSSAPVAPKAAATVVAAKKAKLADEPPKKPAPAAAPKPKTLPPDPPVRCPFEHFLRRRFADNNESRNQRQCRRQQRWP